MSRRPKGYLTFRFAGACFLLSAAFELASITSAVTLFGDVRSGGVALAYHLLYAAVFTAMGIGLWSARTWGPSAVLGGTILYSVDRLATLATGSAALLLRANGYEDLLDLIDVDSLDAMLQTSVLTVLLCWWGFVAYVYRRRAYFEQDAHTVEPDGQ